RRMRHTLPSGSASQSMTPKSSKKRTPDVIDVVVKKSLSELPNEEVPEEIILDDAKEQENQPEGEKASEDQGKGDTGSTTLTPTTTLSRYLAEVRRYPFLSKEEELQLFHEYQTLGTRESAVKLILANLRVCVSIASEYGLAGIDQMDLIQEGNVGLLQAMKKF